jgi:hypothetical protein
MERHIVFANYIQLRETNQNKGHTIYIDGRTKDLRNNARFIKSTWPKTTKQLPNACFMDMMEIRYCYVQKNDSCRG